MSIVDNGHGMSHNEIEQMLRIGRCRESDRDLMGTYGVGFKVLAGLDFGPC